MMAEELTYRQAVELSGTWAHELIDEQAGELFGSQDHE